MDTNSLGNNSDFPLIQFAQAVSRSVLYSLSRQYLDIPFQDADFIQPQTPFKGILEPPSFLRIDQIGKPLNPLINQPFTALQTALAACHNPERYTLIFLITSNGSTNQIYLGVRSHNPDTFPSAEFTKYLGHFLQANWPGTKVTSYSAEHSNYKTDIEAVIQKNSRHGIAITGIPSLKKSENPGYPQSLDRLLHGMRGYPYSYMIIAEPMAHREIDTMLDHSRDLIGRIHTLSKFMLTETQGESITTTEGTGENYGESDTKTTGKSESVTPKTGDILAAISAGVMFGFQTAFPPLALLGALGLLATPFIPNKQKGTSTSDARSISWGRSTSRSEAIGSTTTTAVGKEYFNAFAKAAEDQLDKYIQRFEQARSLGCWKVGTYLISEKLDVTVQAGMQLRALLGGENSTFEPVRIHDLKRIWASIGRGAIQQFDQPNLGLVIPEKGQKNQAVQVEHPLGPAFDGLTTPLNTEELALLINLPQREVPGLRIIPTADFSLNPSPASGRGISTGTILDGGEKTDLQYSIPLSTLTKHVLVTGITGSGKSTTCRHILQELHRKHIPFLVIEPAKDEYVEWALGQNGNLPKESLEYITVYMPGAKSWRDRQLDESLNINPFDIVWTSDEKVPQILAHIDRLKSILNASFPMQEALPILLEDILYTTYGSRKSNWLADQLPPYGTQRPTLNDVLDNVNPVVKGKGYEDRVASNLIAALTTRIQSLRHGWKGDLFNKPASTPWHDLFDKPVVINLSQLGDDNDKSLTMALLLQFLYEYRQSQSGTGDQKAGDGLRHLTVLEEAHRILLKGAPITNEQANPQGKVAEMFSNILSEVRAYGEGLLIVDQVASRLIPDAIKNTNLKIVHRIVAQDDRDAMASCMNLNPDQSAIINRLRPGQAIVCGDQDDISSWVQVPIC